MRGVVDQAEQRDQVLDVRGLQVAQAAVLDERDLAAGELELEQVAVMRGPHQHGLAAELDSLLARGQHAVADLGGLRAFVADEDQLGPLALVGSRCAAACETSASACSARALAVSRIGCEER